MPGGMRPPASSGDDEAMLRSPGTGNPHPTPTTWLRVLGRNKSAPPAAKSEKGLHPTERRSALFLLGHSLGPCPCWAANAGGRGWQQSNSLTYPITSLGDSGCEPAFINREIEYSFTVPQAQLSMVLDPLMGCWRRLPPKRVLLVRHQHPTTRHANTTRA